MQLEEIADQVNNLSFEEINQLNGQLDDFVLGQTNAVDGPDSGADIATLAAQMNQTNLFDLNPILVNRSVGGKHPC